jgi:hypothetical protein
MCSQRSSSSSTRATPSRASPLQSRLPLFLGLHDLAATGGREMLAEATHRRADSGAFHQYRDLFCARRCEGSFSCRSSTKYGAIAT